MGKNKRLKATQKSGPKKPKHGGKGARPVGISKPQPAKSKPHSQPSQAAPTIPFSPSDRIVLIGEGDLSFARSLIEHHRCENVTATVYEKSREELEGKYPHAGENITALEEAGAVVRYGVDASKMGVWTEQGVMKGKGRGLMDRVIFNFPHVGGKSTDVNRQVRYNQELLVSFFKKALPSLAPSSPSSGGSIIVTLFEGEPYTLWNIRDLARHSGLQVERSFKFQAKAYPGYKHARTLGVVKGRNGEVGGGWKGEDRSARSFVFVRKVEGSVPGVEGKRRREESSDEEDEEEEEEEEMEFVSDLQRGDENEDQDGNGDGDGDEEEGHD